MIIEFRAMLGLCSSLFLLSRAGKEDQEGEIICTGSDSSSEAGFPSGASPFGILKDFMSHDLQGEGRCWVLNLVLWGYGTQSVVAPLDTVISQESWSQSDRQAT